MKLSHQGLAFVILILGFELSLLGVLGFLEWQAEAKAKKAEYSNAIVSEGAAVVRLLYDEVLLLAAYGVTKNDVLLSQYESARKEIPERISRLEELSKHNSVDGTKLKAIAHDSEVIFDALDTAQKIATGPDRTKQYLRLHDLLTESQSTLSKLHDEVRRLVAQHKTQRDSSAARSLRVALKQILVVGILLNILVAILLELSFSKRITSRLNVLTDNTIKLAQSESLNPPVAGEDEIAVLDKCFHDMARTLKEISNRERIVVDNMPAGFLTVTQDGVIESINPSAERVTAYSESELRGQALSVLLPQFTQAEIGNFFDSTNGQLREFIIRRADGSTFPAELSTARVAYEGVTKIVCNLLDNTQQHEVERLKEEFMAMVGHDLQTPLTSIQGFLKLLQKGAYGDLSASGQNTAALVAAESSRLIHLIANLLDVAKMEAGKREICAEDCELQPIFARSLAAVATIAELKRISFNLNEANCVVHADAELIIQVIVNLLSNALKFSPEGSSVSITADEIDGHGGTTDATSKYVRITISDQGVGVALEQQALIFDRFVQARSSDKKTGTGLGLSICKMIVESHGGTIGVISGEGKGSSFWFTLPAAAKFPE